MGTDLIAALEALRDCVEDLRFPVPTADSPAAALTAARAVGQLDDYVLPRLRRIEAPLLAVVAGPTGAGKSTLVNGLVGRAVTRTGVLRPTTRHPVLAHHPTDAHWFVDERILPRLPRISGSPAADGEPPGVEEVRGLQLVAADEVPPGLGLLDAPDIDSVSATNRQLAGMLMRAADLWIFVTTAARYADAVPWDILREAVARDAAIAMVLNRVPPEAVAPVVEHLRGILAAEGLAGAPLFVVPETPMRSGMLATAQSGPVRAWLDDVAGDPATRAAVARRTLDGAIAALVVQLGPVADAADRQAAAAQRLAELASAPFSRAEQRVLAVGEDGSLLRGEVLARWQEFVGAGETFRRLEAGMGRLRDRVSGALRGRPTSPEPVAEALGTGLARVLVDELATALDAADAAWRDDPAGRALLSGRDLARAPAGSQQAAQQLVRDWQGDVLGLIRAEGADRRSTARALAYGVNGAAVAVMVVVFSATGGLTGAEVGIAGGSAVLAQKLLEAVFGEEAVRRMSETARERLESRVHAFFSEFRRPFLARLEELDVDPQAGAALRVALACVSDVRPERARGAGLPAAPEPAGERPRWRERVRTWLRGGR